MKSNTFISDQFNTWKKCKKRYYFKYLKSLNWPEFNTDYTLGKSIHSLIDYKLRNLPVENLLKNADSEITSSWKYIENHPILQHKPISTEWPFDARIRGTDCWLRGRIDAILYDEKENHYIIADWKTGMNIPKTIEDNYQHIIYLYVFYNAQRDLGLSFKPEELLFQYIKISKEIEVFSIPYSLEEYNTNEKLLIEMINEIEEQKDYPKSIPCPIKNCQYSQLCRTKQ